MHEDYRNKILAELGKIIQDQDLLLKAIGAIDFVMNNYEIIPKETAIVSQDYLTAEVVGTYLGACKCGGKRGGQSKGTIKNKYYALSKFFKTIKIPFQAVTTSDIRAYLYVIADTISNTSAEKARQYISGFFEYCTEEKLIKENPCKNIGKIRCEKTEIKPLTADELYKLRTATQTPFEKALIEFMYSTGARIAEVAAIKKSDINLNSGEAYLFGKGQKHRTTFISVPCEYAIREYLKTRDDDCPYLFVSARGHHGVTTDSLRVHVHAISARAGLYVNPHQIRHTTATNLQGTMPIQNISRYLGHENIGTTMIYAQVNRKTMKTEFERAMN